MKPDNKTLNELLSDKRFFIDDFTKKRVLDNIAFRDYEFVEFPIGKIYMEMELENRLLRLDETVVYKFLADSSSDKYTIYDEYCNKYGTKNPNRNINSFENLISDLDKSDYDPLKGVVMINQYGFLLDGQHRTCIILQKYGKDAMIPVLKLHIKYSLPRKAKMLAEYILMKTRR